mgnify:FL=1
MPWTIIIQKNDTFIAILEILSIDAIKAWQQAKTKHSNAVGMFKGNHTMSWHSYD